MKNTIKLDHENRRIVMDKTFAKLSADVRNEEYDILQRVRRDYPTYEVANRKIKKNIRLLISRTNKREKQVG